MKKVLAWVKKNLLVVVFSAIILIVLPASYFVSTGWNKSVRDGRQKAVDADVGKLKAATVNYVLPKVDPNAPDQSLTTAPNAAHTQHFAESKKIIEVQAGGVVKSAEEFNVRHHRDADGKLHVLVEGLLPASSGPDFQSKARRLAERLSGANSAYKALFDNINAGEALPGAETAGKLADFRQREVDQIIGAQAQRALTTEESAKITKSLVERRKTLTQNHARRYSVYGTPAALSGFVPMTMSNETVSIKRCFQYQADFWLVEDLLAAVKLANTAPDGQLLPIIDAPVKRIERITPKPSPLGVGAVEQQAATGHEGEEEVAAPAAGSPTDQVAPDFSRSVTGRWSGPGNAVYDVRKVEMVLVVSSKNLPKFFDAVSRTNFMTVTDCDLFDVDQWVDVEQGYYYGEESVVRARVEIETVWLRSWTTALMPKVVKEDLGIAEPEAPAEDAKTLGEG